MLRSVYTATRFACPRVPSCYLSPVSVGVRPDGTTPSTIAEQADQVFANLVALLEAHNLAPTDIVKLTTFMVSGQDGDAVRAARLKYLGSHRPASTAVSRLRAREPGVARRDRGYRRQI